MQQSLDRETELAILYEISSITAHIDSAGRIYELALEKACRLLNAELVVLYRYIPTGSCLEAAASYGVVLRRVTASYDAAHTEELLAGPLHSAQGALPPPIDPVGARYPVRAALGLPLTSPEQPLGWLYVARIHLHPFEEVEVNLFSALARQVSGALEILVARDREHQQRKDLETANARMTAALAEVQQLYQEQQRLIDTIQEISTPVLRISARALLFPIVGVLDSQRLAHAVTRILSAVSELRAEVVLLDITGIPMVDSEVASGFVQLSRAARLLGAEVWISGVGPEVAQVIVALGVEMGGMRFVRNLAEAIGQIGLGARA